MGLQVAIQSVCAGIPGRGVLQISGCGRRVGSCPVGVSMVAERSGRALRFPHGRGLWRVTSHRVAGAGTVFRRHLSIFHNLLDLGPFVLEPDFYLEQEKEAAKVREERQG